MCWFCWFLLALYYLTLFKLLCHLFWLKGRLFLQVFSCKFFFWVVLAVRTGLGKPVTLKMITSKFPKWVINKAYLPEYEVPWTQAKCKSRVKFGYPWEGSSCFVDSSYRHFPTIFPFYNQDIHTWIWLNMDIYTYFWYVVGGIYSPNITHLAFAFWESLLERPRPGWLSNNPKKTSEKSSQRHPSEFQKNGYHSNLDFLKEKMNTLVL